MKQLMADNGMLDPNRSLQFRVENILDTDISDATVVYSCGVGFSKELMNALREKFKKLKTGTSVLLDTKKLRDPKFKFVREFKGKADWNCVISHYILQ